MTVDYRDNVGAASGFCSLYNILHIPCSLQLVIDMNFAIFHINIRKGKPSEFGNTHAGLEENANAALGG